MIWFSPAFEALRCSITYNLDISGQMDSYKANNRDKKATPKTKKAIPSEKSLDDSSFTVSPLKRRQSTEPLKQNTSQNVIRCVCWTLEITRIMKSKGSKKLNTL